MTDTRPHVDRKDLALACALSIAALALYSWTPHARPYSDSAYFALQFLRGEPFNQHVFYLPLAYLAKSVGNFADPIRGPLLAVSIGSGALGIGLTYFVSRAFDVSRVVAALACVLTVFTPSQWFFSTTIEVQGMQFCSAALCACIILYAPWQRFWLALGLTVGSVPLLFFAHQSGLILGAGMVALISYASHRARAPVSLRRLLLFIGPVLLAAFAACYWVSNHLSTQFAGQAGGYLQYLLRFFRTPDVAVLWTGFATPVAVLLGLAAIALVDRKSIGHRRVAWVLVWTITPFVAFLAAGWTAPERGAYFQGCLPILAAGAGRGLQFLLGKGLHLPVLGLILMQAWLGWSGIADHEQGYDPRVFKLRSEVVQKHLGARGFVLVGDEGLHPVTLDFPGITELDLTIPYQAASGMGQDQAHAIKATIDYIRFMLRSEPSLLLDLSFRKLSHTDAIPYFTALEKAIRHEFNTEDRPHATWPMLEIVRE